MFKREISSILLTRIREPRRCLQVVVGPRQVGKTMAVQQALSDFGGACTYRLVEGLVGNPVDGIEEAWNQARLAAKGSGGHVLVFDEIQKAPGWSERVKRLWDEDTFTGTPLKVVLLGSSRLLLQKGLNESLMGRFELIEAWHWSFGEMQAAFGFTMDDYVLFGGYPGAAEWRSDESRWMEYVRNSIVEPSISNDILQMEQVNKPALLRRLFYLGCNYSARILSYQKMLGQLQDAGNATTLAHYLRLLGEAGLLAGLEKFSGESVRTKASSPKLAVCNNALSLALASRMPSEIRNHPEEWGHVVESAVGAHLLATARKDRVEVFYWNVGAKEVDFVLRKGDRLAALEVKSASASRIPGIHEFKAKYPMAKAHLIGGQGIPLETFFASSAIDYL